MFFKQTVISHKNDPNTIELTHSPKAATYSKHEGFQTKGEEKKQGSSPGPGPVDSSKPLKIIHMHDQRLDKLTNRPNLQPDLDGKPVVTRQSKATDFITEEGPYGLKDL